MTRPVSVGLLLILLGVLYGLMGLGWQRRSRRHASAAIATAPEAGSAVAARSSAAAEGTYISTTSAESRHERVVAAGLGARSRATMRVDQTSVRWAREGADEVHVDAAHLLGVGLERGMAGTFVGQERLVVVSWRAEDDAHYATGFLPRYRADIDPLVTAVQRLRTGTAGTGTAGTLPDGEL